MLVGWKNYCVIRGERSGCQRHQCGTIGGASATAIQWASSELSKTTAKSNSKFCAVCCCCLFCYCYCCCWRWRLAFSLTYVVRKLFLFIFALCVHLKCVPFGNSSHIAISWHFPAYFPAELHLILNWFRWICPHLHIFFAQITQ